MELKLLEIKRATSKKVQIGRDIYEIMKEESKADRECFWVLHLNTQFYVIEKELVAMGALNRVPARPREVFRKAVINSTNSVILIHNHPSGIPLPSEADEECNKKFTQAGDILGINVVDFMIIGRYGYFSFYEDAQKQRDYLGQIGLFVEHETVCIRCGEWIKKESAVEWNGLIYCPYCWEVCFGEMSERWLPEIDKNEDRKGLPRVSF